MELGFGVVESRPDLGVTLGLPCPSPENENPLTRSGRLSGAPGASSPPEGERYFERGF